MCEFYFKFEKVHVPGGTGAGVDGWKDRSEG